MKVLVKIERGINSNIYSSTFGYYSIFLLTSVNTTSGIHTWNSWPYLISRYEMLLSMVETTLTKPKTKTMKTKTTKIVAMIVIATIISFASAADKLAFAAGTPPSTSGSTMFKLQLPTLQ
ncbi:MAG TPA: hypothetical protein VFI73_01850 [Candidatus Nitrosopolaris sp.]|nr:hypothetical protein [Candidatus Nitrosopolaris sp.]